MYLSANNNELVSSDTTISQSFTPTSSGSSLSTNSWGYSLDSSSDKSWSGISTSQTQIASLSSSNYPNGTNTNIYYGINANTEMPAGTYSTIVTYTAVAEGIPEQYTMQGFTLTQCTNMNTNENIVLMDTRDGKNYRVTKLADGNCWMTENLKLDGGRELTSADTNLPSDRTVTLPANIANGTASNMTDLQIINNLDGYDGNLYNWCAATLLEGSDCATTVEPTQDICPKGWRLPSNTGSLSYTNLFSSYGMPSSDSTGAYIPTIESTPLSFTKAGYYLNGYSHTGGIYWTRGIYRSGAAYNLNYDSVNYNTNNPNGDAYGFSLRCVLESRSMSNITYMQDMTSAICNNTSEHYSKNLTDNRDNKSYRVTKLKDGNCWMTQNLALDGGKTITPANSDVRADVTLPANITSGGGEGKVMEIATQKTGYDGNYYNWCSAIVHDNCSTLRTEQTESVCPRGFRLPSGNGDASYSDLFAEYSVTSYADAEAGPLYFIRAGDYNAGYFVQGTAAYYWTRSVYESGSYRFFFYYNTSSFNPANIIGGYVGMSLRCLVPGL